MDGIGLDTHKLDSVLEHNVLVDDYITKVTASSDFAVLHDNAVAYLRALGDVNALGDHAVLNLALDEAARGNERVLDGACETVLTGSVVAHLCEDGMVGIEELASERAVHK